MKKLLVIIFCILSLNITSLADAKDNLLDNYFEIHNNNFISFSDLDQAIWAKEPIEYLAKYGIVSGYGNNFSPMDNITRAEFIKILILGYGAYDESASSNFADSTTNDWHYPYVSTAKKLGITNGIGENNFGSQLSISREEMVTLAYKMASLSGTTFEEKSITGFADIQNISAYAVDAVNSLKQKGIITGDLDNNFNPTAYATRAETCKIIYLLLNLNM